MKSRIGFVSNSSSTSFLIATKEKLSTELLSPIFEVDEKSYFYRLSKEIIKTIIQKANKTDPKEYMDEMGYDEGVRIPKIFHKAIREKLNFYCATFYNDDCELGEFFRSNPIKYEDENIIIHTEE